MKSLIILSLLFTFAFEVQEIQLKNKKMKVEVAKTKAERSKGLMFRKELKDIDGMLFVFPKEERLSFWMKNTLIPLSIAFFNKEKVLIEILDMEPHNSKGPPPLYKSSKPAKYALEVPKGWFGKNHIGLGSRLVLADKTLPK